jgi:putative Ca2+/H+ antiporter (TMEM165/GDT1 family)
MMKNKIDWMGVVVISAHLLITLAVVVGYIICLVLDRPAPQLETAMFMILAYWFGAMLPSQFKPTSQTQINQANEVKVQAPHTEKIEHPGNGVDI